MGQIQGTRGDTGGCSWIYGIQGGNRGFRGVHWDIEDLGVYIGCRGYDIQGMQGMQGKETSDDISCQNGCPLCI